MARPVRTIRSRKPKNNVALTKKPLSSPMGVSGLTRSGGRISEDFLQELNGKKGREKYYEMSTNATIAASLFSIRSLIGSAEWEVESVNPGNAEADAAVELVDGILSDLTRQTWHNVVHEATSAFIYGFSLMEPLWRQRKGRNTAQPHLSSKFEDGIWTPYRITGRSQRSLTEWIYGKDEEPIGFCQRALGEGERKVLLSRCLHFVFGQENGNPEGTSILRGAYKAHYYTSNLEEIQGFSIERNLAGLPVLKVPEAIAMPRTPDEMGIHNKYLDMLAGVRFDEVSGIMLPSDTDENGKPAYEFNLLSASSNQAANTTAPLDRYDRAMARTMLTDFMFLGSSGGGAYALSADKTELFGVAVRGFLNYIGDVFTEQLVGMIWRVNGFNFDVMPRLVPGKIEDPDLAGVASYIEALVRSGVLIPDETLEGHMRTVARLPKAPEGQPDRFAPVPPTDNPEEVDDPEEDEEVLKALSARAKGAWGSEEEGGLSITDHLRQMGVLQ